MANNRKVISVVILMFGLLLCSCAQPRFAKASLDEEGEKTLSKKEELMYQVCEKRGYKRVYNQEVEIISANSLNFHKRSNKGGARPHPDHATEEEKSKKSRSEIEQDYSLEVDCRDCLSVGKGCDELANKLNEKAQDKQ